ncbi:MAG: dephospho-CoA kinase [Acetobacter sp.]|nr:dephospho-CoA kinase [Acetobacter sp.]
MILAAITGSIGCGKTTISNILRKQGFLVYDIDKWVKLLYYKKEFLGVVQKYFPEVFDEHSVFNKRALRDLVFSHPEKLKILEELIHPFLTDKLRRIIRKNKNSGLVFVDVALLYEMGWDKYFNFVVLADVEYEKQKSRVMKRDHITAEDFEKINRLQMPQSIKKGKADFIIDTDVSDGVLIQSLLFLTKGL